MFSISPNGLTAPSLNALLRRMSRRDRESDWNQLITWYGTLIRGACRDRIGSSGVMVDDAFQETLLQIQKALKEYVPVSDVSAAAWLRTLAGNTTANLVRGEIRRKRHEHGYALEPVPQVEDDPERFDDRMLDELRKAIAALPARERQVIEQRYFYRLSGKEIAEKLGLTVPNVDVIACRALRSLREALSKRNLDRALPWCGITGALVLVGSQGGEACAQDI